MVKQKHTNSCARRVLAAFLLVLFSSLQLLASFHHHPSDDHQKQEVSAKVNLSYSNCTVCMYVAHHALLIPQGPPAENPEFLTTYQKTTAHILSAAYISGHYLFPLPNSPPFA